MARNPMLSPIWGPLQAFCGFIGFATALTAFFIDFSVELIAEIKFGHIENLLTRCTGKAEAGKDACAATSTLFYVWETVILVRNCNRWGGGVLGYIVGKDACAGTSTLFYVWVPHSQLRLYSIFGIHVPNFDFILCLGSTIPIS